MVFRGRLAEDEIDQLAHEQESSLCGVWMYKAQHCPMNNQQGHEYIPISWQLTERSKHVGALMCTRCFHEINVSEAFEKRTKL